LYLEEEKQIEQSPEGLRTVLQWLPKDDFDEVIEGGHQT
jgi:hypothetical protein